MTGFAWRDAQAQDVPKEPSRHSPEFYVDKPALLNGVSARSSLAMDHILKPQR